jgi:predicted ferric reductase
MTLAVFLAIAHVLAIGKASASVWLVSLLAALGVGWRVLRTDRGGAARPYQVGRVRQLAANVTEVDLRPLAAPLDIAPGQFVMTAFFEGPRFHGCGEYHPYTVSRIGNDGTLALSIKALGDCTRNVQRLVPGTAARVQGPFGDFLAGQASGPAIWIAGGIGVTPFLAVLRALPVTQPTEFFYLHRGAANSPHLAELRELASAQPTMRFHTLVMQQDPARLFDLLSGIADLQARQAYLCGPPPLIDLATRWLVEHGLRHEQIHFEHFDFRE